MKSSMFQWTAAAAVAGLFLLAGTGTAFAQTTEPTQQEVNAFRTAVDTTFHVWCDTSVNPDLERFMRLWDDNAVKMASGKPTVYGRAAVRKFRQAVLNSMIFDRFEINAEEYQLAGRFGWARGTYLIAVHPKAGGGRATNVGTFLTVFKHEPDGTWKVYRDTMMDAPK